MLKSELIKIEFNEKQELILHFLNNIIKKQTIFLKEEKNYDLEYISEIINNSRITLPVSYLLEDIRLKEKLDKYVKYKKINNISLFKELVTIKNIFEENKIEYACFKGPVISHIAYNNVNNREYTDLDIFIDKNNFPEVKYLLIKEGYEPYFKLNEFLEAKFIEHYHYYNLYHPATNTNIDLNFGIERNNLSFNFSFEDLKSQLVEVEIEGTNIKTFDIESTVILLILHGSKHGWAKLLWILDITILANNYKINWHNILSVAKEKNFLKMLLCYCRISEIIFCIKPPSEIDDLIKNDKNINSLALETIYKSINSKILYNNYYYYRSMDIYSDRIKKFTSNLRPTPKELSYEIPRRYYFVYYIIRIFRLTYKLSSKMGNSLTRYIL